MKHNETYHYIDSNEALAAWVERLTHADVVAIDTESDSFHRYREKVCLLQMTALGEDAIIDPLAVTNMHLLAALFADSKVTKIFHDAGYDLVCLGRDYDFRVTQIFDTMLASRLLGWQQFGLAAILQQRFGFTADKRWQRSDWAQRPLMPEQLTYARYDTHFLPRLAEELQKDLQAMGRWEWALEDFGRLPAVSARVAPREPGGDPNGFWRVSGVKLLSPICKGRVRELYMMREKLAAELDRPAFKVLGDHLLLELAKHPPKTLRELYPRPGLRRGGIERFGEEILAALEKATIVKGSAPPGTGRRRRAGRMLDPVMRERYEKLREVRRNKAEELKIDPEVALGNSTLEDLARQPPTSARELAEREEFRGWRGPLFCEVIVTALKSVEVVET